MSLDKAEIIADLLIQKHQLEKELRTDDITGLGNLRALREELMSRKESTFGLLFIDVDHFKSVNERHGHMVATNILRELGIMLRTLVASRSDRAYRYAGDEFVIVMDTRVESEVRERAEEIRRLVQRRIFRVEGFQGSSAVSLTVSIGCRLRLSAEPVEQILAEADRALFEAKRKSRDTSVFYAT